MKTIIKPKTYKILLILKGVLIGIKHMEKDGKKSHEILHCFYK